MSNSRTAGECLGVLEGAPVTLSSACVASSSSLSLRQTFCFLQSVDLLGCPAALVYDGVRPLLLQLFSSDGGVLLSFGISYQ
jgi:hypothetical protein